MKIELNRQLSGKIVAEGQKPYECMFCGGAIPAGAESYAISEYANWGNTSIPSHKWRGHTECWEGWVEERRLAQAAERQAYGQALAAARERMLAARATK